MVQAARGVSSNAPVEVSGHERRGAPFPEGINRGVRSVLFFLVAWSTHLPALDPLGNGMPTIPTHQAVMMKLKVNLFAIPPIVKYLSWLA